MFCEDGCRVNLVAKFGDFRRLVVEVLQWNVCCLFFEKKRWVQMAVGEWILGFLLGFSSWWSAQGRGRSFVDVLEVFSGRLLQPPYWFGSFAFVGFLGLLAVLSMAEAWA